MEILYNFYVKKPYHKRICNAWKSSWIPRLFRGWRNSKKEARWSRISITRFKNLAKNRVKETDTRQKGKPKKKRWWKCSQNSQGNCIRLREIRKC